MACGTPVIGVREAGVQESVIHEQTGLLVSGMCESSGRPFRPCWQIRPGSDLWSEWQGTRDEELDMGKVCFRIGAHWLSVQVEPDRRGASHFPWQSPTLTARDHQHWRGYEQVLVTGGAGFIGSHVAEALVNRDDQLSSWTI